MASACCCIHQIWSPNLLKQHQQSLGRPSFPRFCALTHRRLMLQSPANVVFNRRTASRLGPVGAIANDSEAVEKSPEGEEEEKPKEGKVKIRKWRSLLHIVEHLTTRAIEESTKGKNFPDIQPGYVLQIKRAVPGAKRETTIRGIVIARRNNGISSTFVLRNVIAGVGVEVVYPLYDPKFTQVTILKKVRVRRAKLYYLRKKLPRYSTF